jgi:hypothetical protein
MASTVSKKRLRRAPRIPMHDAKESKSSRRRANGARAEVNWLDEAREARAHTPMSPDSTELLRELRVSGAGDP